MKRPKQPPALPLHDQSPLRSSALADRLRQHGLVPPADAAPPAAVAEPPGPAPPAAAPPSTADAPPELATQGKLVLRRTRKGRGGKTVTTIDGVQPPALREELARQLRRALGCGAVVEDELLVLQGDQLTRTRAWLTEHGARKLAGDA